MLNSSFPPNIAKLSRYYYDGHVHVIAEFDGVRLITNDTCEFLHKVSGRLLGSEHNSHNH